MERLALIGCGRWGRNIARNLTELGVLETVFDPDRQSVALANLGPDVRIAGSLEEALTGCSGVVIATPPSTHAELALAAIDAGAGGVLVEKPLALTYADGLEVVERAAGAGCMLMTGHLLEYHPGVEALSGLIASGELGGLRYLYSNRVNLGTVRTEENILWSFAPHDLGLMASIVGEDAARVSTWGGAYLQDGIADVTVTNIEFAGGVRGHVFVSWLHPFKEQRFVVVGDRRMAVFRDGGEGARLTIFDKGVEVRDGVPVARSESERDVPFAKDEPLRRELEHFLACLRDGSAPRTDGVSGLKVLRLLESGQRSLEAGGEPVSLDEVTA